MVIPGEHIIYCPESKSKQISRKAAVQRRVAHSEARRSLSLGIPLNPWAMMFREFQPWTCLISTGPFEPIEIWENTYIYIYTHYEYIYIYTMNIHYEYIIYIYIYMVPRFSGT